ncbi:WYL domain-containing protein [Candidatus Pacearchaeota archaeon]|nr:WYL domain-containing protein [Candidatus Pacearchaeota archaeon]
MIKDNKLSFNEEELSAAYKIIKDYEKDASEGDKEYYDTYEKPIKRKVVKAILNKINISLPKEKKDRIDKDFLRKKYHTFNNDVDEKVYRIIEKAFSELKTIEIKYFNMESAEFSKRKLDVYYKSRRYTIGYCHLRKEIRNFRTSRIAFAKLTNEPYKIPTDFDKHDY